MYGYYVFRRKRRGAFGQTITELDFDTHYIVSIRGESFEVDPSTVGQYTGLTDKNGKRIFEGDIVKVSSHSGSTYYAKIEYDCGCYWVSNTDIQIPDTINHFNMVFVVVEGNIHDNSDLLEEVT